MSLEGLLPEDPPAPQLVHFLTSFTLPTNTLNSRSLGYGDVIEITDAVRQAGLDRAGRSWVDLIDQPDEQVRRWGQVCFAAGPWPAGLPRLEPGSEEARTAMAQAYKAAWAIPTDEERLAALGEVRRVHGRPPVMNHSVETIGAA